MKRKSIHKVGRKKAMIVFLSMMCFIAAAVQPVSAADGFVQAILPIEQTFTKENAGTQSVEDEIQYKLTAVSANAPLPEGGADGTFSFVLKASEKKNIGISYDTLGVYEYHLKAETSAPEKYYTYETHEYDIRVYVLRTETDELEANVVICNQTGQKAETMQYSHSYKVPSSGTNTGTTTISGKPVKTGDTTNAAIWITIICIALGGIVLIAIGRAREKKE